MALVLTAMSGGSIFHFKRKPVTGLTVVDPLSKESDVPVCVLA